MDTALVRNWSFTRSRATASPTGMFEKESCDSGEEASPLEELAKKWGEGDAEALHKASKVVLSRKSAISFGSTTWTGVLDLLGTSRFLVYLDLR